MELELDEIRNNSDDQALKFEMTEKRYYNHWLGLPKDGARDIPYMNTRPISSGFCQGIENCLQKKLQDLESHSLSLDGWNTRH